MTGYRLNYFSYFTDSAGATGIEAKCSDASTFKAAGQFFNGSWVDWSSCASGTAICGFKVLFESWQGYTADDTALNDVEFYCCRMCDRSQARYLNGNICAKCDYSCKTCSGGGNTQCNTCYFSDTLSGGKCSSPETVEATPTDWTMFPVLSSTDCGMFTRIVGGYSVFGKGAYATKSYYDLPPHFKKRILVRFIKIDKWNNESAQVYIDMSILGTKTFSDTDSWTYGNQCGMNSSPEAEAMLEYETVSETTTTSIKITSTLVEDSTKEAWAFQDFYLAVVRCHGTCKSCNSGLQNDCNSCYELATLQADKTCKCNDGYYAISVAEPCSTFICTVCTACYTGCKNCVGASNNQCTSCFSGYYYNSNICYQICPLGTWGNTVTNNCDAACASNYYGDIIDRICKICDTTCRTCSGAGPTLCLTCPISRFQELGGNGSGQCLLKCYSPKFADSLSNNCVTQCPLPYWGNVISDKRTCDLTCLSSKTYQDSSVRECKYCDNTCLTCSAGAPTNCLTCTGSLYYSNSECLSDCGAGKYGRSSDNTCQTCDSPCAQCITPDGPTICTACTAPDYLNNNQCLLVCSYNQYKSDFDRTCKNCDSSCLTCSGGSSMDCLTCDNPRFFVSSTFSCVTTCPINSFGVFTTKNCINNCPESLMGNQHTWTCDDSCPSNEYLDTSDRICKPCHSDCASCSGPANNQCLSCSGNRYMSGSYCVNDCGVGKYGKTSPNTCQTCATLCYTCTTPDGPTDCLSCSSPNYLKASSCFSTCDSNQYPSDLDRKCKPCDSSCLTCNGESSSNCLSCTTPKFLTFSSNKCVTNCPINTFTYIPSRICVSQCTNPTVGNTVTWNCEDSCLSNQYLDENDRICKSCDKSCFTCNGPLSTQCLSCTNPNYFLSNQCVLDCGIGKFGKTLLNTCISCSSTCYTCTTPDGPTVCTSCQSPFFLKGSACLLACDFNQYKSDSDRTCKPCDSSCLTCFAGLATNCLTCDSPKYLLLSKNECSDVCEIETFAYIPTRKCILICVDPTVGNVDTWTCDNACSINQYIDSNTRRCNSCDPSCKSCSGPNPTNCLSCYGTRYLSGSQCLTDCGQGKYGKTSPNVCYECISPCFTCTTPNGPSVCTGCSSPNFLKSSLCVDICDSNEYVDTSDRTCKSCNNQCLTCNGGLSTNCLTCEASKYLTLKTSECANSCPSNSFAYSPARKCLAICINPTVGNTVTWNCDSKCSSNQYLDTVDRICKVCHNTCLTCDGPKYNNCIKCPESGYLLLEGTCICGPGKYKDNNDNTCKTCSTDCKECVNFNECVACFHPKYLKNNLCVYACDLNEYKDYNNQECKSCHPDCLSCFGGSKNECLSCNQPYFFFEQESNCLLKCPFPYFSSPSEQICLQSCATDSSIIFLGRNSTGKCEDICSLNDEYPDYSDRICKACHSSCLSCDGPSSYNCKSCQKPFFLKENRCLIDCGPGFYNEVQNFLCQKCSHPCRTCSDSPENCLECEQSSNSDTLVLKGSKCVVNCGEAYFLWFDNVCRPCSTNTGTCITCHKNCETCNGETEKQCLSCRAPFYLKNNNCVQDCGLGFYTNSKRECVTCLRMGEYGDSADGMCKNCPQECASCNNQACTKCISPMFVSGWTCSPLSQFSCQLCETKVVNCIQCEGTNNACLRCKPGYYLYDSNNDNTYEECTECNKNDMVKIQMNNTCNHTILGCDKCTYYNTKTYCIQCQPTYYLLDFDGDQLFDICTKCLEEYYYIDTIKNICLKCGSDIEGCLFCNGNKNNCTKCGEGYFLKKKEDFYSCSQCKNQSETLDVEKGVCLSCLDVISGCEFCESQIKCRICGNNYILYEGKCVPNCQNNSLKKLFLEEKQCLDICEVGYFELFYSNISQIVCEKCSSKCETCEKKADLCLSCLSDKYLLSGSCLEVCPSGYHQNIHQRRCTRCSNNEYEVLDNGELSLCSSCEAPCTSCLKNKTDCTSCELGLYLYKNTCGKNCSPGTYADKLIGVCVPCDKSCNECSGKNNASCTNCKKPNYFHESRCIAECPVGFYKNETALKCDSCHFSCRTCVGSKEFDCLDQCFENRLFLEQNSSQFNKTSNRKIGFCLCKDGYFEQNIAKCKECHFSCGKCDGPFHTDCLVCAGNRGDNDNKPKDGICNCPSNTFEYLYPYCFEMGNQSTTIFLVEKFQNKASTQATFFSTISLNTFNIFGLLYNIVEVAQEINLYCFLNTNKPLNLENLLDFLSNFRFYKYFSIFSKLNFPNGNGTRKNKSHIVFEQEPPPLFLNRGLTSSFLSNTASLILILILIPLLLLAISSLSNLILAHRKKKMNRSVDEKKKKIKPQNFNEKSSFTQLLIKIWGKRNIIFLNILFALFLSSVQELQFFFALQMINISFSNAYNTISFICSVTWIVYEVILLLYIIRVYLKMNPKVSEKLNVKKRITVFFKNYENSTKNPEFNSSKFEYRPRKTVYDNKQTEKYSFFFGKMIKNDEYGMSFFFYRIAKKIILPMIHVFCHLDINKTIFSLIIFYALSLAYLRVIEPYRYKVIAIISEGTELLHINFLLLVKFYVNAIELRNSELALALGLFMIYIILAIILFNLLCLVISLLILILSSLFHLMDKKKKLKESQKLSDSRKPSSTNMNKSLKMDDKEKLKIIELTETIRLQNDNLLNICSEPSIFDIPVKEQVIDRNFDNNLIESHRGLTKDEASFRYERKKISQEKHIDKLGSGKNIYRDRRLLSSLSDSKIFGRFPLSKYVINRNKVSTMNMVSSERSNENAQERGELERSNQKPDVNLLNSWRQDNSIDFIVNNELEKEEY